MRDGSGERKVLPFQLTGAQSIQGTFHCLAISMELLLRSLPALEDQTNPRHLSLASADLVVHYCRVSPQLSLTEAGLLSISNRLPGTPLWLAAVYTDSFASFSKYWAPAMW